MNQKMTLLFAFLLIAFSIGCKPTPSLKPEIPIPAAETVSTETTTVVVDGQSVTDQVRLESSLLFLNDDLESVTEFAVGETIRFRYVLKNRTGETATWTKPDGGPIAAFEVYSQNQLILSSVDGQFYSQVIEGGSIPGHALIKVDVVWQEIEGHPYLLPGIYTIVARPRITVLNGSIDLPLKQQFMVIRGLK